MAAIQQAAIEASATVRNFHAGKSGALVTTQCAPRLGDTQAPASEPSPDTRPSAGRQNISRGGRTTAGVAGRPFCPLAAADAILDSGTPHAR